MPELPEVETIVRDLKPNLVGQTFECVHIFNAKSVNLEKYDFDDLKGVKVKSVERRGKFINIFFEKDFVVTIHLRMSGRVLVREKSEEELRFERVRLDFSTSSIRFTDIRKFGKVWLNKLDDYKENTGIYKLGIEPFNKEFSAEKFKNIFNGRKGHVKKWLLDQTKIAGIGNIYADEACFYAGVRPDAQIQDLNEKELDKLFESVVKALEQGIRNRGTSISDFADAYGKTGRNQELLYVYGRGGEDCMKCKSELIKTRVAGRGTVYCKKCQKA